MVFTNPTFLFAFLPLVLLATWAVPTRGRRFVLLAASLVFYAWGVQEFVLVVVASTLVDFGLALGIERARAQGDRRRQLALLTAGIVQNVGLLAFFKYAGPASEQLDSVARQLGLDGPGTLDVLLPIGISFFTFEKISYLVDVHRGDVAARRDPFDLLLFVSLFPRAIAGPIVRLREIRDELHAPRPRVEMVQEGAIRFVHGLMKKVLVADQIAPVADAAFQAANDGTLTMGAAWIGALAFALQLYFDFSGYSDMAIGIALMLGFRLPENFRRPYSSRSMTEFWRRWHMTLSRWFRDYVYIPLGGNRGSGAATYRNLIVVFALTGIWHGAALTFLVWGLYHGTWLLIERRFGWRTGDGEGEAGGGLRGSAALRRATTFLIVLLGWVLFRADGLGAAATYYQAMVTPSAGLTPAVDQALDPQALTVLVLASAIVLLPGRRAGGRWLAEAVGRVPGTVRTAALGVGLPVALAYCLAGAPSPFLYFQF
jgi:alginate O-acetyltransferase complex protein AlgI